MSLPTTCKFCGAVLTWRRVSGKDIPYDFATGPVIRPHWDTCPAYTEMLDAAKRGWSQGVKEQR